MVYNLLISLFKSRSPVHSDTTSSKPDLRLRTNAFAHKTVLRVYNGQQIGTTAFFRNRPLLSTLATLIQQEAISSLKVLFHAGSIGAEAYSFSAFCHLSGIVEKTTLDIRSTDINPAFLDFAQQAVYDSSSLDKMSVEELTFFEKRDDGITPIPLVRNSVQFLAPMSFVDAEFDETFDIVFVMNALTYVTPEQQSQAIARIARYNSRYLVISAFHPDSIKNDLLSAGYEPVGDNAEAIHNEWDERRVKQELLTKGMPQYSYGLGPYGSVPDADFRHCAIFRKKGL